MSVKLTKMISWNTISISMVIYSLGSSNSETLENFFMVSFVSLLTVCVQWRKLFKEMMRTSCTRVKSMRNYSSAAMVFRPLSSVIRMRAPGWMEYCMEYVRIFASFTQKLNKCRCLNSSEWQKCDCNWGQKRSLLWSRNFLYWRVSKLFWTWHEFHLKWMDDELIIQGWRDRRRLYIESWLASASLL